MRKKLLVLVMTVVTAAACLTGCGSGKSGNDNAAAASTWSVSQEFSYKDIASWGSMQTPSEGSGAGSIAGTNDSDGYVTIQAASDGWGGVESGYFEIDLSKDPIILAKIFENPDGYSWGMKVVPENPIEDHEWGLYIIPDNNLKWNKYAGVDLKEALGDDFTDIYGEQCNIKLWIYPAGGPEGTVSVSEILVVNTK